MHEGFIVGRQRPKGGIKMENDPRETEVRDLEVLEEGEAVTNEVCACCKAGSASART